MKTKWLLTILAVTVSASLSAQQTATPPGTAAPAPEPKTNTLQAPKTNPPATKPAAKKAAKKAAPKKSTTEELRTVPLVAGPATVIASNVNVRGQATISSEVVAKLQKGEPVTVIEEVMLKKSKPDEPSAWAKIVLPGTAHAWVHSAFIHATDRTVLPRKLNLRSGAGENYSVIGLLKRGDAVKEITTKGDWLEIEAPTNAYAFVAAQYLKQEAPTVAAATPAPEPTPVPTPLPEPQPVAVAPTEPPATTATPTVTPQPTPAPVEPAVAEPPPPRVVAREGVVKGTISIQAPTRFALVSPDTGRTINYLYTSSTNLDLSRYKGLHIIVTGEEGLDERWKNTPVITIQRIQVLE